MSTEAESPDAKIQQIVEACLEAFDEGRTPDLAALCDGDLAVEAQVRRILGYEPLAATLLRMHDDGPPAGLPERLGPYALKERIGAGGMGQVFVAVDPDLGREVALKLVAAASTDTARFRREATIAAALDHPNIVPIHGIGEDGGSVYIAMKRLTGPGLDALAAPMSTREAASVGAAIARALQFAHEAGVVHRDVKPGNIVLDRGVPHLVDFGLARSTSFATMTAEGQIVGTLPYMAPERFQNADADTGAGADIYGLGASLYECVTGRPCFAAPERAALLKQILLADAPPLRLAGEDRGLEAIILRALQKDRRHRFPTAQAMADDLESWLAGRPISSRRDGVITRAWRRIRRHPRVAIAAAVVALAVAGLVVAFLLDAAARRKRIEADVSHIDEALSRDELGLATKLWESVRDVAGGVTGFPGVSARLQAATAVEELLDALLGEGPASTSMPAFVASVPRSELMARVEATRAHHDDALFASLALAHAALTARDLPLVSRILDGIESDGRIGVTRATTALRAAAQPEATWKPPAVAAKSPTDNLFTALVMRSLAAPFDEREREIEAAFGGDKPGVHYRVGLCLVQLRSDQGSYREALALTRTLERPTQRNDALLRMRAHLHVVLGDGDAALRAVAEIPEERRVLFDEYLRLSILRTRGDTESVAAGWRALEQRWPGKPEALLAKGYFALDQGRVDDALAAFESAARLDGWYHYRELAAAEALNCRFTKATEAGAVPDADTIDKIRSDAAASTFRLPYARSTALLVESSAATLDDDRPFALAKARDARSAGPENPVAALWFAHLAFDTVVATEPSDEKPLTLEMRQLALEGIESAATALRLDGRRGVLPPGRRAAARYYEAALALLCGDRDRARTAAAKGLAEPAEPGPNGAAVTAGLEWVAGQTKPAPAVK